MRSAGEVAEHLAGVELDDRTKQRLWRWCRGNALFIGEVIAAARERGLLEAPEPVRKARALARDGDVFAPYWDRWAADDTVVHARERTRERADLVIDRA